MKTSKNASLKSVLLPRRQKTKTLTIQTLLKEVQVKLCPSGGPTVALLQLFYDTGMILLRCDYQVLYVLWFSLGTFEAGGDLKSRSRSVERGEKR